MAVTVQNFRANFPAFASTVKYPDSSITFWLTYAYLLLPARRWMNLIDLGAQLFVAHNVTLDQGLSAAEGANGAPSGMTVGPVVSKSVGDLTIAYDVGVGVNEQDGHWSLTNYGTRFVKMARQIGSGPIQVGIGIVPPGQFGGVYYPMGPGWPGPLFENFSD